MMTDDWTWTPGNPVNKENAKISFKIPKNATKTVKKQNIDPKIIGNQLIFF